MQNKWIKKIVAEPLTHFFLVGGLLFLLFNVFGSNDFAPDNNVVVVSSAHIDNLAKQWSMQMGRPTTEDEITGFINKYIREEILSREAIALGLDKDDIVIRRRLVQKIQFMNNELSIIAPATENELLEYYNKNQKNYKKPSKVSFVQVLIKNNKNIHADPEQHAKSLLDKLNRNKVLPEQAINYGDATLLPARYDDEPLDRLHLVFGNSTFTAELEKMELNQWEGPLESDYGYHLVYITGKSDEKIADFKKVRKQVLTDCMDEKRNQAQQNFMKNLRDRYIIKIDDELLPFYEELNGQDL